MKILAQEPSSASCGEIRPAARPPAEPLIFRVSTEVLITVFSFLDKRSCFRIARTCKRFKEPALDQLWREITTLTALLGLLDELINTGSGLMFRNGLGQVDWPKYWSYAHRIRGVYITDEAGGRAARVPINPQALLHALAAATSQIGHSALLPKARALAFEFHHASGPSLILPLVGPTVRRITIKILQPTEQIIQAASIAFSTLISMSRNLKLEQFDITIGDDVAFATTGTQTDIQKTLDSNIARFVVSQSTFQRLRISPFDSFDSLARAILLLPYLRALEITCVAKLPLRGLIISLATCTSLERLEIRGTASRGQHAFCLIQPLLSCSHLISLDLSGLGIIALNSANVEDMGKAWVKLEFLRFSVVGDGLPVDLLLTVAASFSPSLRYLALPLDISNAKSTFPLGTDIPSHDLKLLYTGPPVNESHIQPFAELLGTLFRPGFHVIFGIGSRGRSGIMEVAALCDKVNGLLQLIWRVQDRACQRLETRLGAHVTV